MDECHTEAADPSRLKVRGGRSVFLTLCPNEPVTLNGRSASYEDTWNAFQSHVQRCASRESRPQTEHGNAERRALTVRVGHGSECERARAKLDLDPPCSERQPADILDDTPCSAWLLYRATPSMHNLQLGRRTEVLLLLRKVSDTEEGRRSEGRG